MRIALAAALVCLLAACGGGAGGGSESSPASSQSARLPAWVKTTLAAKLGPDVAATMGSSDFSAGKNRVVFLIVRGNGALVHAPAATVRYAAADGSQRMTTAVLQTVGAHSHGSHEEPDDPAHFDVTNVYVAHVETPAPGRYWFVADPAGEQIQAMGTLDVERESQTPSIGTKAPASDNPTLADAPAKEITTAHPPDKDLLHYSIADSLAAHVPFVVVFATPEFCVSRVCGPSVEVVQHVARKFASSGTRFIHVEIYTDNNPKKGYNKWVREWNLPTEPWVFLVDGSGIVRGKFEGAVSVEELEKAVQEDLRSAP
jgi:hypothetical protein